MRSTLAVTLVLAQGCQPRDNIDALHEMRLGVGKVVRHAPSSLKCKWTQPGGPTGATGESHPQRHLRPSPPRSAQFRVCPWTTLPRQRLCMP